MKQAQLAGRLSLESHRLAGVGHVAIRWALHCPFFVARAQHVSLPYNLKLAMRQGDNGAFLQRPENQRIVTFVTQLGTKLQFRRTVVFTVINYDDCRLRRADNLAV
jgi:hypothetical protein